jgi:hypothetical protein
LGANQAAIVFHDNCNILRRHGYEPLEAPSEQLNLAVRGLMVVDVDIAKLASDMNPRLPEASFNAKHFVLTVAERDVLQDWTILEFAVSRG